MVDLKRKLIAEIQKIDNDDILSQLSDLLIDSDELMEVEFTEEQIVKINESQNQIKRGDSFDHDTVMKILND